MDKEHLTALIENMASGTAVYEGTELLYCSAVYTKLFGYDDQAEFRSAVCSKRDWLPEFLSEGFEHFEFHGIRPDGTEFWIDFSGRPITWSGRQVLLVTAYDISHLKKNGQAAEGRQSLLRQPVNARPLMVASVNDQQKYAFLNLSFAQLIGVEAKDHVGVSVTEKTPGEYQINQEALALALDGQQLTLQTKIQSKTGHVMALENYYSPRHTESGQDGVYIVVFDVSERMEAAVEFRASEDRFLKLIGLVPLGILRVDMAGCIGLTNNALDAMLGYEGGELLSSHIWDLYAEEEQKRGDSFFNALRKSLYQTSGRWRCKDDRIIDVVINWVQEYDESGKVCGLILVVTDITADLLSRHELQAAKDAAEGATREKSRFLAAASHDLQQPLHSLSILLGLLNSRDGVRRQEIISLMERAIEGAREIVRGVIDISKLEAGVIVPRVKAIPVREIFAQIEAELAPLSAERPIKFSIVESSAWVKSDRQLLKAILHNLVSNAIRYTSKGKILVGARLHGKMLRLYVYDTGRGIPKDRLKDIFLEFTRLERGEGEHLSPGIGLGLSIVQRACLLLGHELTVRSESGRGSMFMIEVPYLFHSMTSATERKVEATNYQKPQGLVLLIEDDPMTAFTSRDLIQSWGNRCLIAQTEAEALQIISEEGQKPHVILADYNLEDKANGIQVIDRIRSSLGCSIPAILMTANDSSECEEAARLRGIPVIRKPANPAQLRALLSYLMTAQVDGRA